jgi:Alw26I/Eco31I/Esp3I family type II restriction m6 adenine DNA methyltransferase
VETEIFVDVSKDNNHLFDDLNDGLPQYIDSNADKRARIDAEIKRLRNENEAENNKSGNESLTNDIEKIASWDPYDQSAKAAQFFDPYWMFGIKDGFDVVIGNPPYAQVRKGIYSIGQFSYSEGKDKGKQNLYKLFVELAYNLLKDDGCSCLIVQSSLLCDMSSQYTRELLLTRTTIKTIIEFPKIAPTAEGQVFGSVLQGTCIYISIKTISKKTHCFSVSINNDKTTIGKPVFERIIQSSLLEFYPESFCIPLIRNGEYELLRKINNASIKFKKIIKTLNQGDLNLTTSKDYITPIRSKTKLLRGRNILKYTINYTVNEYVKAKYRHNNVKLNNQYSYLVCQEVTGTVDKWRLHFALTNKDECFLFGHTANKVLLKDQNNNLILLALLNSKLLDWYFRKTSTNNHVGGYEIEQLPIALRNSKTNDKLSAIVGKILAAKATNQQADTSGLERQIDNLVYRLYDLTYDEVKVIEPEFPLSKAEYEGIEIK